MNSQAEKRPGTGRNDLCPCGSGRKYKRCHLAEFQRNQAQAFHNARAEWKGDPARVMFREVKKENRHVE